MTKKKTTRPKSTKTTNAAPSAKGRPKGSRTADRPEDAAYLARCPHCQSTNLRVENISRRLAHRGIDHATRQPYNLTLWHRCTCDDCDRKSIRRTHYYHPETPAAGEKKPA